MPRAYGPDVLDKLLHALVGSAVWLMVALATATGAVELSLIDVLLLLAPLVLVPIGLVVAGRTEAASTQWLRLAAAALIVPALLADRGGPAGALAVPWLVGAVALAVATVRRWLAEPSFSPAVLARVASPLYLVVGATWLVASRLGLRPVGIGEPIVELTAVHFHFAGFVAALVAARTCEVAGRRTPRLAAAGALLTIAAPPFVALGFTTEWWPFQVGGALLLSVGLWTVAGLTLAVVTPLTADRREKALLSVSALAVAGPMVLAVFWAAARYAEVPALDIPAMARIHGTMNAFGFSLAGLLGWVARDTGST
jgi:hypothetical protein